VSMGSLSKLEYEWLTGWRGVKGASYNQIYEFLLEDGLIDRHGHPTAKGYRAIMVYESFDK
jgi:hypothetical protein